MELSLLFPLHFGIFTIGGSGDTRIAVIVVPVVVLSIAVAAAMLAFVIFIYHIIKRSKKGKL